MSIPEIILREKVPEVFSDSDLSLLIEGSAHRRFALVKRALARGSLIQIRRGLYTLGDLYRSAPLNAFPLAQRLYGPSYISFESALSHHGLIPEAVYSITSACSQRSSEFQTPFGHFLFRRIPYSPLYFQVDRHVDRREEKESVYFIAQPLRALCDYVYYSNLSWTLNDLQKSLRLEEIPQVDRQHFDALLDFCKNTRVQRFLRDYKRRFFV